MSRHFALVLLCIALAAVADELDHDRVKTLRDQGEILPLSTILQNEPRLNGARILEVELENEDGRLVYEIEYLAANQHKQEVYVDARSGELLAYEVYTEGDDGRLRSYKYDATSGELLEIEDD